MGHATANWPATALSPFLRSFFAQMRALHDARISQLRLVRDRSWLLSQQHVSLQRPKELREPRAVVTARVHPEADQADLTIMACACLGSLCQDTPLVTLIPVRYPPQRGDPSRTTGHPQHPCQRRCHGPGHTPWPVRNAAFSVTQVSHSSVAKSVSDKIGRATL